MSDTFVLADPRGAQSFLRSFPEITRRKGEACFAAGGVNGLECKEPGRGFAAQVEDTFSYHVSVFSYEAEGWDGDCTCPQAHGCRHIYATVRALLAEHSAALTRSLSAGTLRQTGRMVQPVAPPQEVPFASEVATKLGRPLKNPEKRYLAALHRVFEHARLTQQITASDLAPLGMSRQNPFQNWQPLRLWPSFPQTEREFWLYLAHYAVQQGWSIPEFMEKVSDLEEVRERLRRWERTRAIEQWKGTLLNLGSTEQDEAERVPGEADLRLCIGELEAWFEWRPPGEPKFYRVKHATGERALRDHAEGLIALSAEAELLLAAMRGRYGNLQPELHYQQNSDTVSILGSILRQPALASRVVTMEGVPLERPAEPLRWDLRPPDQPDGDYALGLVQANGQGAPPALCVLEGHPVLYLTQLSLFRGPPLPRHALDPAKPALIPAAALETEPGLRFLHSLAVEPPPPLRERMVTIPMVVVVRATLQPRYIGSKTESCALQVTARTPAGDAAEQFAGTAWIPEPQPPKKRSKPGEAGSVIVVQDRALMRKVPALMESLGAKWDGLAGRFFVRVTKKFPEEFLSWLKTVPPEVQVRLEGELASLTSATVAGSVRLEVSEAGIDWFDLRVVVDASDTTLTPAEIRLLLDAKGGFVRLGAKGWRRLAFDLSTEEDERLARLGLTPHELTSEPQRLHALQLADEAAKKFLPAAQAEAIARRAGEIRTRVTPDLPAAITAQLRPYQLEGFHFLAYLAANHFGGVLADDMGLGKTLQTLAWLAWLREQPRNADAVLPPSLVVCPKSVMDNWRAETARFAPSMKVKVWRASDLEPFHESLATADLHVLNYAQLRSLSASLIAVQWLAVILDEGQYIKNPGSQTAQVARALHAQHRLVLTGTPIENRLLDLWSLMSFAMPAALGSRAHFQRAFDAKEDPFARRRLASRVRPFLLRRTKAQVARDLPDRIEEDLYCEIEGEQLQLYRAELKRAQQMLLGVNTQKQLNEMRFSFLTSLLRLRQICCHPKLVKPDSSAPAAKSEALLDQLEPLMEEGQKVLVFSQFVELLHLLKPQLQERGWPVFYLAGETENRGALVEAFQSKAGAAIFLISLRAGGFGLNLTAASYVVLFDPWWNPAVESQAIDRTHRIGQVSKVIAYRLLIKDSIEEKIRALQREKSSLAQDVLGEEKFAQALTLDDLRFLLDN
jgi:hypothetical protein